MSVLGFTRNFSPLEILTEEQVEAIHRGTLNVLERTGLRIEHERALKLFEKNGCRVDYDNRQVRIPPGLVQESLDKCPSSFRIRARDSNKDLVVGANTLYVSNFPGMETVDLDTWESQVPSRKEFYDGVTVLDALDNLHFASNYVPYFGFEFVPSVMRIPEGFAARVRKLTKVTKMGYQKDSEIFTINIAKAVDIDAVGACCASPPLTYYADAIESLYRVLEADFPVAIISGGFMGGSAPTTVAGSRLTDNAELIAGLVLAQLIRPKAKTWVQINVFPQNMRSGTPVFGAIEASLHGAMSCQYFRKFEVPVMVITGCTGSKRIDFQCGYEKASLSVVAALSGANGIYLSGGIFGELTFHPVQAILDDDMSGMIGRLLRGVEVNDETLALDLINEVGPIPGFYLNKEHTRKWWRREHFMPKVADRLSLPEWMASGKKIALDYAKERMEEILATHKPTPLPNSQEEKVERILEEARKYYKNRGLISEEEMGTYRESMKSPNYPYE